MTFPMSKLVISLFSWQEEEQEQEEQEEKIYKAE